MDRARDDKITRDSEDEDNRDNLLRLPTATPPSHRPVPLNHHLQRTRPGQAFPRKRTERKAWWQDLDDTSFLLLPIDRQNSVLSPEEASPPNTLMSVFVLTEQLHSVRLIEDTTSPLQLKDGMSSSAETLPKIDTEPMQRNKKFQLVTNVQPRTRTEVRPNVDTLSRSESAPATLTFENDAQWSKQKRSRGVAAALESPLEFHVGRDKGADFLQKQRERVYQEKGASRIRHARTPAAQAHVMEARVCRALGKRHVVLQTELSPLSRPDRHTVENAVATLAKAAQLRESTPQGFITEAPVRGQSPAKNLIQKLPTSPLPAMPSKLSVNPETQISCGPVAPW
ncbi:hypothetical protein V7S43_002256 [Phytophthora oleae]|uniref:Uncharacterized protein n=1 Tax=Phytophthora oleae TaxID=2107226 RepID=A0ABD3G4Q6_9STRA